MLKGGISKSASFMMEPAQDVIIRPAHRSDTFGWLLMRQKFLPNCIPAVHKEEIQRTLNDPENFQAFVAEQEEGNLIGFIEASIRHQDGVRALQIRAWYVETFFRKQNTGKQLMHETEVWARARGLKEIFLDVKFDHASSQQVHKNLGFDEISRNDKFISYRKAL